MRINRLVNTLDIIDYLKLVISEQVELGVVYQSFDHIPHLPTFLANLAFNEKRPKFALVKDSKIMSALEIERHLDDDACEDMEDKIILDIFIRRVLRGLPIVTKTSQVGESVITREEVLTARDSEHITSTWEETDLYSKLMYIGRTEYFSNRNLIDLVVDKKEDAPNE